MHADPTCSDIGTSCSGRLQHPLSRLRDGNAFPSQLVANAKAAGLKTFAYTFRSEVRLGPCNALPPSSNCWATGTAGLKTPLLEVRLGQCPLALDKIGFGRWCSECRVVNSGQQELLACGLLPGLSA